MWTPGAVSNHPINPALSRIILQTPPSCCRVCSASPRRKQCRVSDLCINLSSELRAELIAQAAPVADLSDDESTGESIPYDEVEDKKNGVEESNDADDDDEEEEEDL